MWQSSYNPTTRALRLAEGALRSWCPGAVPSSQTCLCLGLHGTELPCIAGINSNGMLKTLCRLQNPHCCYRNLLCGQLTQAIPFPLVGFISVNLTRVILLQKQAISFLAWPKFPKINVSPHSLLTTQLVAMWCEYKQAEQMSSMGRNEMLMQKID